MAFPLFLFAVYLLILPMRMMRTSMQMQQICEQTCELLAEAAYLQQLAAAGIPAGLIRMSCGLSQQHCLKKRRIRGETVG